MTNNEDAISHEEKTIIINIYLSVIKAILVMLIKINESEPEFVEVVE